MHGNEAREILGMRLRQAHNSVLYSLYTQVQVDWNNMYNLIVHVEECAVQK